MLLARQLTIAMLWLVVCWLVTALKSTSFGWIGSSILGKDWVSVLVRRG